MKNPPIIIIGAGRSGTNILRDCICSVKGFETWPSDEINYIWRHGNNKKPDDSFIEGDSSPKVKKFIKSEFDKFEKSSNAEFVVEKTCANSLKVSFIASIFPNAKYIFLVRDGKDVSTSAKQRWTASLELKYIWKKVKYVPLVDMPYYGLRYFVNRIKKLFSKEKRLAFWGPLYPGMMSDLKQYSLLEVCAKQWATCVVQSYRDLSVLNPDQVHFMKYEEFVQNPQGEIKKVFGFLGSEVSPNQIKKSTEKVSARSIGNYKKNITNEELKKLNTIIEPIMDSVYYKL
jgi:hypothetical protein